MKFVLPKLRDILFIAIFSGVVLAGQRSLNIDGDLGRHITLGQFIIENKMIPNNDLFSHTMPGEPLTPHEWLAEVMFKPELADTRPIFLIHLPVLIAKRFMVLRAV